MKKPSTVTTVNRLVRVLNCFSTEDATWSLAALSSTLGLPKSTLHRFLVSLEAHGILRRDPEDRLWRLGFQLVVWGRLAEQSTGLEHVARPIMQDVARQTGEMTAMTVYSNHEIICVEKIDTRFSVRLALDVGTRRPAHAGASSKILMAFLPAEEVQAILQEKGLPKLCTNTITDMDELMADLAHIREAGYALSIEETDPHAWGIATPIHDSSGEVVAAIGIAGPTIRFSDQMAQEYVAICRQAAQQISRQLGNGVEV